MVNEKKSSSGRFSRMFSGKSSEIESLREEVRRLERSVKELTIVSDLAFALGGSAEPEEIVEKLVDKLMRAVNAEQAVVTLLGHEADDPAKTSLRLVATSAGRSAFHMTDSLIGWMYLHKEPLILNDPRNDERFKRVKWSESMRTMMCVPLMVKSELTGILTIYNKKDPAGFTEDDQRLLTMIAAPSATLIENARLYQESVILAHMKEQAEHAFEIQRNLLPKAPPEIDGYDIAGASTPAQTVGGDYFDFIPGRNNRWVFCLGDVSGKGLPASLLMANLQATLRAQMLSDIPVDERLRRSNTLLCESTDDEKFATLFYGELNVADHTISFGNAGHENPLLFSGDGVPERLDTTGVALGAMKGLSYEEKAISMKPGDLLVVYSDGITDATNELNEAFGAEKLISVVEQNRALAAAELIQAVFKAVNEHAGEAPQFDDLTLVVVRRATS